MIAEGPANEAEGTERTQRLSGLELSLWLLLAFIGLNSSAFFSVSVVAEAVGASRSDARNGERAAQPASFVRVVAPSAAKKMAAGPAPTLDLLHADLPADELRLASTVAPRKTHAVALHHRAPFQARAPPITA